MRTAKQTIVIAVALAAAVVSAEPSLVPAPRHMKVGNGVYAVKATNINDIVVHTTHDKSLPPEGYRLVVTTGCVSVASADAAGTFYATTRQRWRASRKPPSILRLRLKPCRRIAKTR